MNPVLPYSVMKISSLISLGLLVAVASSANAASLMSDFSIASNPNGDWSYGYKTTGVNDTLSLFAESGTDVQTGYTTEFWRNNIASGVPGIYHVVSGNTYGVNGGVGIGTGDLALHGGPNGEIATARWTAPSSGNFDLSGFFKSGDALGTSRGNVDCYVFQNSTQLFSSLDTAVDESFSLSNVSVTAGDTIDIMVGIGKDDYYYDSTPVELSITAAVPEPASMIALGLGAAALLRRKRK